MEGVEKRVSLALGTRGSPSPRVLGGIYSWKTFLRVAGMLWRPYLEKLVTSWLIWAF